MSKQALRTFAAILTAAAMITSSFTLTASAAQTDEPSGAAVSVQTSGEKEGNFSYYIDDDETVTITKYYGKDTDVTIPVK